MRIHLDYTLTLDDFAEFQRAYIKHRKILHPRNPNRALFLILFLGLLCTCIFTCAIQFISDLLPPPSPLAFPPPPPSSTLHNVLTLLPYVFLFFIAWIMYFKIFRSKFFLRSAFNEATILQQLASADITDDALTLHLPHSINI